MAHLLRGVVWRGALSGVPLPHAPTPKLPGVANRANGKPDFPKKTIRVNGLHKFFLTCDMALVAKKRLAFERLKE
jgi:hypothetical protein